MPVTRSGRARVEDAANANTCAAPAEAHPASKRAPRRRTTGKSRNDEPQPDPQGGPTLRRNDSALDTSEAAATARQRDHRTHASEATSTSGAYELWFDETVSRTAFLPSPCYWRDCASVPRCRTRQYTFQRYPILPLGRSGFREVVGGLRRCPPP